LSKCKFVKESHCQTVATNGSRSAKSLAVIPQTANESRKTVATVLYNCERLLAYKHVVKIQRRSYHCSTWKNLYFMRGCQ
jgi:hypothetical protein